MKQLIMLILIVLLAVFIFLDFRFKHNKSRAYQNDERWQLITIKADKVMAIFLDSIVILLALAMTYFLLTDGGSEIMTISDAVSDAFYIYALKYPVEYCAYRYYDQVL